jgi:hypothetical protein
MTDAECLTAAQILAIPPDAPARLFGGDAASVTVRFRRLAKIWHPEAGDPARRDRDVFQRIVELRRAADRALRDRRQGILRRHRFELGEMLIGADRFTVHLRREFADLHDAALAAIRALRVDRLRDPAQYRRMLPDMAEAAHGPAGPVLVLRKDPGLILLRDLLDHAGGRLSPRHAAWILTRLHNLACYLSHAGLVHNAIGPDSVFVEPRHHGVALLGGWFHAVRIGAPMQSAPARTIAHAPSSLLREKRGDPRVDLELVKATGREMLGAESFGLDTDPDVPRPLLDWLRMPTGGDAIADYAAWEQVRDSSLGPRRFARLETTASDVYGRDAA